MTEIMKKIKHILNETRFIVLSFILCFTVYLVKLICKKSVWTVFELEDN